MIYCLSYYTSLKHADNNQGYNPRVQVSTLVTYVWTYIYMYICMFGIPAHINLHL